MRPLLFALLLAAAPAAAYQWPDYSKPEVFLKAGSQSYLSPEQFDFIKKDAGITDQEMGTISMVGKVYAWMGKYFTNETDGGKSIGKNTAAGLLAGRNLYGCTDWALMASSVFRAGGMPSLMVDAVGIGWMDDYRKSSGTAGGFHGHVFTEVLADGLWILAEHNTRDYFQPYNPNDPVIPMPVGPEKEGFFVMRKGVDPAAYGINSVQQLNDLMKTYAMSKTGKISKPTYSRRKLPFN